MQGTSPLFLGAMARDWSSTVMGILDTFSKSEGRGMQRRKRGFCFRGFPLGLRHCRVGGHGQPWMLFSSSWTTLYREGGRDREGRGMGEVEDGVRVLTAEAIELW